MLRIRIITFLLALLGIFSMIHYMVLTNVKVIKTENESLQSLAGDSLRIDRTPDGKKVATETSIEVSKSTFEDLNKPEITRLEEQFQQDFNRVQSKTDIQLETVTALKAVVKDTVAAIPGTDSLRKAKVIHFKSTWKNEEVVIIGDTAYSTDTSKLRIVRMETLGKRTRRFLFVRYGPRKREYKTLIFNPNTGIVSISNMSVIK
jgi:hypothetical protein